MICVSDFLSIKIIVCLIDYFIGFTSESAGVAQLGLGHSYSRAKVKFNVHRSDNMIIQSITLLDQLDKDVNTFSMRIREWYSYHFPELVKIVPDNYVFAKAAKFIKDRKLLTEEKLAELEEIVMDSGKAQSIYDAAKMSMGMDISPIDLMNIELFADRVVHLSEYRNKLANYLHNKMTNVAPNLQSLIGDQVGARLISHAGSLTNLAKFPASTVQILGAEKALFRAIKTRTNTPKFGLLYNSTYIGRAGLKNKGRISRFLANKCSIASRIDCFLEQPTSVFGDFLKEQVEERLKFYESGEVPRKNVLVMKEAIKTLGQEDSKAMKLMAPPPDKEKVDGAVNNSAKKQKKKRKSGFEQEAHITMTNGGGDDTSEDMTPKKKKGKKLDESMDLDVSLNTTSGTTNGEEEDAEDVNKLENGTDGLGGEKRKKKKKKNKNKNPQ